MRGTSPVWRALERARDMNLAAAGERASAPLSEGVSRRRVLAAIAGGVGLAALPRWPAFAQTPLRVAVIGGGLAGLTALDTLRLRGIDATLYEARAATGGRTRSVRGVFAREFAFDEGAQLVNTDHEDLLGLIRRFGLRLVDRRGFGRARELQIGRNGGAASERALAFQLRGIAARISADSDRIDGGDDAVARDIDALSVAQYLDRHRLRPGDARDALEAAIRTEYGAEPSEASALQLIFNLPTVEGRRVHRLTNSDERYLVSGGTAQIAAALAAEHEGAIHLNKRLAAVDFTGDPVRLRFADGAQESADRVILALPVSLLREVEFAGPLPPLWRSAIDEVRLGRNEKVIVGYERPAWRRTIGFGGAVWAAGQFSAIWDAVSLAPADGPGALCYYLGGDQVDAAARRESAELARDFSSAAARVLPGLPAPNGRVRRTRWCDDPLTRGAYSSFRPGQITRFAPLFASEGEGAARASQAGPLLFAGEWLSESWSGFMNGAVQTGRLAAEAAMAPAAALAA